MVPPFLAYAGALTSNLTLLTEAHTQCALYRQGLQDGPSKLWRHVALGDYTDPNLWATGNGWAAYGMLRVAATFSALQDATLKAQTADMQADLLDWAAEIIDSSWTFQDPGSGLLHNYIDQRK